MTHIFNACLSRNLNLVKYLVEHELDINKESIEGLTPLFNACKSGNLNLVKYLIRLGVDINKEDNEAVPRYLVHAKKDI